MSAKRSWKDVPIPERMARLTKDRRGYPVPAIVLRDKDGRPHFTINDDRRVLLALLDRRCSICGDKHEGTMMLAGGPLSAFHEHGAYIDPPMHRECLEYAMQVCPYLALPSYAKRIDAATLSEDAVPDGGLLLVSNNQPTLDYRPEPFVCVETTDYDVVARMPNLIVKPVKPYVSVEYWRHGEKLDEKEGAELARQFLLAQKEQDDG